MGDSIITVFKNGEWTIELRPRNNAHEGEPNMKVWVIRVSQEVAQFSSKYRGYGAYKDNEAILPVEISDKAKKVWEKLKTAPLSEELVEEIKSEISE